jgi:hypothetical protein
MVVSLNGTILRSSVRRTARLMDPECDNERWTPKASRRLASTPTIEFKTVPSGNVHAMRSAFPEAVLNKEPQAWRPFEKIKYIAGQVVHILVST